MAETKKQASLLASLSACAIFISLISFLLLPLLSFDLSFLGTYSSSGMNYIIEAIDEEEIIPALSAGVPLFSTLGLIFSLIAIKSPKKLSIATIIFVFMSMILLIVSLCDSSEYFNLIEYAGIGFYLYAIMSVVAIILSIVQLSTSSNPETLCTSAKPDPLYRVTVSYPDPTPIPQATQICPNCHMNLDINAKFCNFCGAAIGAAIETTIESASNAEASVSPRPEVKPTPEREPVPQPVSDEIKLKPSTKHKTIENPAATDTSNNWFRPASNINDPFNDQK